MSDNTTRDELPRPHPRNEIERDARLAVRDTLSEYDLTPAETVRLLAGMLAGESKYLLRMERHGDYETPADVASDE